MFLLLLFSFLQKSQKCFTLCSVPCKMLLGKCKKLSSYRAEHSSSAMTLHTRLDRAPLYINILKEDEKVSGH